MAEVMGENGNAAQLARMKELHGILLEASRAYYAEDREIMSNFEYDRLYDELQALEEETGVVLAGSPTRQVGYASVDELPKLRHEQPMLSLDKTKSRDDLAEWLGDREGLLSWKLDGLTVVLTYEGGELAQAVTRGNGEIGEVITPNARTFRNLPLHIPYKGRLILRGEAIIRYSDFEEINRELEEEAAKDGDTEFVAYKNPRNLCSGSVRQLSSEVTAKRRVRFYAFSLVEAEGVDFHDRQEEKFRFLASQGFEVVEYRLTDREKIRDDIHYFEEKIKEYDLPSDGLVLLMNDIAYGESLGRTAKFPRNAIAFKWADELAETTLREVEWSASRTGLINPVAIFDPVELEGTTVRRASVHNVSILRGLKLGIGDRILVYKANMIIPQIAENLTGSGTLEIPAVCPVCGGATEIRQENDTETLVCGNPDCAAKKLKAFSLFVSRPCMNVDGLSEATLEKLIAKGFIHSFADIYHLAEHREEIAEMDGFGEKSADNLLQTIEVSRKTQLRRVLSAVGIPGIGPAGARAISAAMEQDPDRIRDADAETLSQIEGIGPVLAGQIAAWFSVEENRAQWEKLLAELTIEPAQTAPVSEGDPGSPESEASADDKISGKTFVITGSLEHFENRDALKDLIADRGGKVAGSVSKKTDFLINNDAASASSKNKKAKELGVPIITEDEFLAQFLTEA